MKKTIIIATVACMLNLISSAQTKYYKQLDNDNRVYTYDAKTGETEELEIASLTDGTRPKGMTGTEYFEGVIKSKSPVRFNKSKRLIFIIEMDKRSDPQEALALYDIKPNLKTNNREIIKGSQNSTIAGSLLNKSKVTERKKYTFTTEKIGEIKAHEYNCLRWLFVENLPAGEYYWQLGSHSDNLSFFGIDSTGADLPETPTPVLTELVEAKKVDPKEVVTPYEEKYSDGAVKEKGSKKGGKNVGVKTEYNRDGSIDEETTYDDNGTRTAHKKYWSGKLEKEEFYVGGVREGFQKTYGRSGVLEKEESYKNGKQDGMTIEYHRNTKIKEYEKSYIEDKQDGPQIRYNEKGKVIEKGQYYNGEMDGRWEYYTDLGKLQMVMNWKNGQQNGVTEIYSNGKVVSKTMYKDGVKQ
jgi:antitoxin component YwqK of YwqJK toxin-antitoxin module